MSLLLQLSLIIISTFIFTTNSRLLTCHNPSGCTWNCPDNNTCYHNIYNCTTVAHSCTLHCNACNGTKVFSSSNLFTIICIGSGGCENMDITAQTESNHIHIVTDPLSPTRPIYPNTTFNIWNTNIIHRPGAVDVVDNRIQRSIKGLTIFATILTSIFCVFVCICVWFVFSTKRSSKLRKDTEFDDHDYDIVDVGQLREDTQSGTGPPPKVQHELELKLAEMRDNGKETKLMHYDTNEGECMYAIQINDGKSGDYMQIRRNDSKTITALESFNTETFTADCDDDDDDDLYDCDDDEIVSANKSHSVKDLVQMYDGM